MSLVAFLLRLSMKVAFCVHNVDHNKFRCIELTYCVAVHYFIAVNVALLSENFATKYYVVIYHCVLLYVIYC